MLKDIYNVNPTHDYKASEEHLIKYMQQLTQNDKKGQNDTEL